MKTTRYTQRHITRGIASAIDIIWIVVSTIILTAGLVTFDIFAFSFIFTHFEDVIYKVIFFFILLTITVNIGVKIGIYLIKSFHDRKD